MNEKASRLRVFRLFSFAKKRYHFYFSSDTCGPRLNRGEIEQLAGIAQPELTLPRLESQFNISCTQQLAGPTIFISTSCYVTADVFFARVAQLVRAEES